MSPNQTTNCSDHGVIPNSPYMMENNTHGRESLTFTQCVHLERSGIQSIYKWDWDWPNSGTLKVRGYPEVIFGHKPWSSGSTTTALPKKLASITRLDSTFTIQASGTGVFNTAYDLWIVKDPLPILDSSGQPTNIHSEIMIWTANQGLPPAGNRIAIEVTTAGTFALYRDYFPRWKYLAFVRNLPLQAGLISLQEFLEVLIRRGEISPEHYLASVEFGNEIAYGKGTANLTDYTVAVS